MQTMSTNIQIENIITIDKGNNNNNIVLISQPTRAGVKRHVIELLQFQKFNFCKFYYIYNPDINDTLYEREINSLKENGVICIPVKMKRNVNIVLDLVSFLKIFFLLKKIKPSIVHTHSAKAGFLGRIAAKFASSKIKTVHTPNSIPMNVSEKYLKLEKIVAKFTDFIIAVTKSEKEEMMKWDFIDEQKIQVIHMGIKNITYKKNIKKDKEIKIMACGEIRKQKNTLLFFKVAEIVLRKHDNYKFIWVGDFYPNDEESNKVKIFIENSKFKENLIITGWQANPNILINDAKLFCMFSRYESFGFVTADAMMMGVPVLAVPATGSSELIKENITGFMCEPDKNKLSKKIIEILSNDKLINFVTKNAKEYIKLNYSMAQMLVKIELLYKNLINVTK